MQVPNQRNNENPKLYLLHMGPETQSDLQYQNKCHQSHQGRAAFETKLELK